MSYTGINKHEGEDIGLYDTVLSRTDYQSTFVTRQMLRTTARGETGTGYNKANSAGHKAARLIINVMLLTDLDLSKIISY